VTPFYRQITPRAQELVHSLPASNFFHVTTLSGRKPFFCLWLHRIERSETSNDNPILLQAPRSILVPSSSAVQISHPPVLMLVQSPQALVSRKLQQRSQIVLLISF